MYDKHSPSDEAQAENQLLPLLMTVYTPHFDFGSCNFTLKHMCRVDSGDSGMSAEGTGRVFYGKHAGVLRSYTLECNYNTGKVSKERSGARDNFFKGCCRWSSGQRHARARDDCGALAR